MTSLSDGFLPAVIFVLVSFISGDVLADTDFELGPSLLARLKLLGQAHVNNGSVSLTRDLPVPYSGAGRIVYPDPVVIRRPGSQHLASFSTFFSFSVSNMNPSSIGGGLAFVISPTRDYVGGAGGFMGVTDDRGGPPGGVVAVEFDTLMDDGFEDINGNHVGLDLNSMVSTSAADLGEIEIDLKSGDPVSSWVDYNGSTRSIQIYVSYTNSNSKPQEPIVSAAVDLSPYFVNDSVFVGFSGSTQGSTETHTIHLWRFKSSFDDAATFFPSAPTAAPPSTNTTSHEGVKGSGGNRPGVIAGVVTASAFLLAFCAFAFMWAYNKKYKKEDEETFLPSDVIKMPKEFTYKDLKSATKGFHSDSLIGQGAFGTVHKGILPGPVAAGGGPVAVKRCSHTGQGKAEFFSELSIIGTLRHRNLVRLRGWCHEKGEILLVYDLMSNGSLDKALFESRAVLSWAHRVKILLGVASALSYLHEECENQVIHRDIKSSNIMMDSEFNARLGDFGLAKQTEHNASPDATAAAGTMGYLAPEYMLTGRASDKTDVFSFGAVVLEVATGRRPISKEFEGRSNLVDWVWGLHREGRLMEAIDPRLGSEFDEGDMREMRRVVLVGLACSNPDPMGRPGARGVVQMLLGDREVPIVPRIRPTTSLSFSTSQLLMTLQDSVSDLNGMISLSTSSSENGGGGLDMVGLT